MKTLMSARSVVLVLLFLLVITGCHRRPAAEPIAADLSLAIAGFTQPTVDGQAMANYVPSGSETVSPKTLTYLDSIVLQTMSSETKRSFATPSQTRACQRDLDNSSDNSGNLDYWVKVGRCMNADYLLVPQLMYWQERKGGAAGSDDPASVMIDMYVVDVKEQGIATRYRFDEKQVSLAENMLTFSKFVDRGGKWLTARELAAWGIEDGLRVLGLK